MSAHAYSPNPMVAPYFDVFGRCIPGASVDAPLKTRQYFRCAQPTVDLAEVYQRTARHLGRPGIDLSEFEQRLAAIRARLLDDSSMAGLMNAVAVPFLLPQATETDLAQALNSRYLPAVAAAFSERFAEYRFVNHHPIDERLDVLPASRHQHLLQRLSQGDVVGYWFAALSEYSIPAAVQQIQELPDDCLLAGGFDTAAALVACPELLLREDGYPPLLWLAALSGQREDAAYHFEAYGYNLTFNYRPHFNRAAEYWCSGLVVLG